ncbi:zinc finger CCCH domain-containing protein 39-like [Durio zibethinus]|uniref:Zinc finger CCCH domain-containing protein 39-like n=1 Tax=Durio zibethinus TaxID=66656 RepID=A0A6P5XUR9_DURZI|nr:zinc finger CCCH domain-containing protein 39-like [Durio zibethinus]XP_022731959.1 zinc finger CCCH domain-containing protein 39-like [Durio zibethinus]
MRPPPSNCAGSDAIGIWPEFSMNDGQFDPHSEFEQQQQQQPPFKRPRHSEDSQSNVVQCTPTNSRAPMPLNPSVNRGTSNIFFKTRMCAKFRLGTCRNGEGCNFAHGIEDLRQPPPNWQELIGGREEERPSGNWDDDQKIIHRMKLCKKFYNGEQCPYGDRCNFLHEDPSKFRDDMGRLRESSAIGIGTTALPAGHGTASDQSEGNRPVNSTGSDASRGNMKPVYPVYWKTKLCTKWETTGQCPFGDKCHFAHGQAELHGIGGLVDGDFGNTGFGLTRIGSISTKIPANDPSAVTASVPLNEEAQAKKCLFKWKGPRKINRIYGDWIDDMPLLHNFPSQVES